MNRSEYQRYLASREWAVLREQIRMRSGGKCERCLVGQHEQTHHVTYERVGHELLEDLRGVCSDCHKFLSGKSNNDPTETEKVVSTVDFFELDRAGKAGRIKCPLCSSSRVGITSVDYHEGFEVRLCCDNGHGLRMVLAPHRGEVWAGFWSLRSASETGSAWPATYRTTAANVNGLA